MTELTLKFEEERDIDRLESLLIIALEALNQMRFCYRGEDAFEEVVNDAFLFQDLLSQIREE